MEQTSNFLLLIISSLALPFLAVMALLLRRSIVTGKLRIFIFLLSVLAIIIILYREFIEHGGELSVLEVFIALITSLVTYLVLSRASHHKHESKEAGIKALVLAEAFHSLFDGLALGIAFLASPFLGIGALAGILTHELPKMLATLALIRSSGIGIKKTMLYGAISQSGVPVSAILVYIIGESIQTEFHSVDLIVISSLATIIIYILYKEIRHHFKKGHALHGH